MRRRIITVDTRLSTGELGDYHYSLFLKWAFVERQNKGGFGRNIIAARAESNLEVIKEGIGFYAIAADLTPEQLEKWIIELDAAGAQVSTIHRALTEGTLEDTLEELSKKKRNPPKR